MVTKHDNVQYESLFRSVLAKILMVTKLDGETGIADISSVLAKILMVTKRERVSRGEF